MEEIHIFPDNQGGTGRVHELQDSGNEENEAQYLGAESFGNLFHCRQRVLIAETMDEKMSSGGSMRPSLSLQSILMNPGSSPHWRR